MRRSWLTKVYLGLSGFVLLGLIAGAFEVLAIECVKTLQGILNHPSHKIDKTWRRNPLSRGPPDIEFRTVDEYPERASFYDHERWDGIARGDIYSTFLPYDARSILVLADGNERRGSTWEESSLGLRFAQEYPEAEVISGDFKFQEKSMGRSPVGFSKIHLDNTQPLPFEENSLDAILLKNGLCDCPSCGVSCGGIALNKRSVSRFLGEVSRVLDKRNPRSVAILQGQMFRTEDSYSKIFFDAAKEVVRAYPVRVAIARTYERNTRTTHFSYVLITPRGGR